MGAVKHAVRVVEGGGYVVPVRRQPPLVVGYEHFRLDRQGQLLSPKTLIYYDETVLPFLRWLESDGERALRIATLLASVHSERTSRLGSGSTAASWRRKRSWSITGRSSASFAGLSARVTPSTRGFSS